MSISIIGPYGSGGYGYVASLLQGGAVLNGLTALADPTAQVCTDFMGFQPIPGDSKAEGLRPVEGAGSYKVVDYVGGLRQYRVPLNNVELCDGTLLGCAVRNAASPSTGILGLPLFALEYGAIDSTVIRADSGGTAWNALDCLFNTATVAWRPAAQVMLTGDVWPMVVLNGVPSQAQSAITAMLGTSGTVLRWETSAFANGDYDISLAVDSVSLQINNNLWESPGRNVAPGGDTVAISRISAAIRPRQEVLQATFNFFWDVPSGMEGPADWSTTTLTATNVDSTGAAKTLLLTLDHAYVNEKRAQATAVNGMRMTQVTVPVIGVTVAYA
jgi:hypothetical protein